MMVNDAICEGVLHLPPELIHNILSTVFPRDLTNLLLVSTDMHMHAGDRWIWQKFLRDASTYPIKTTINFINKYQYEKLSPNFVLQLFFNNEIKACHVTSNLLQSLPYEMACIIQLLTSSSFTEIYNKVLTPGDFSGYSLPQLQVIKYYGERLFIKNGFAPQDFTPLNAGQLSSILLYSDSDVRLFFQCNLKPQDLSMLSPAQVNAVLFFVDSAERLFIKCGLKPYDLAMLNGEQIKSICHYTYTPQTLFNLCGFHPRDFKQLTSMQINAAVCWANGKKIFVQCGFHPNNLSILTAEQIRAINKGISYPWKPLHPKVTIEFLSKLSPEDIRFLFSTDSKAAAKHLISSTYATYPDLLEKFENLTITKIIEEKPFTCLGEISESSLAIT